MTESDPKQRGEGAPRDFRAGFSINLTNRTGCPPESNPFISSHRRMKLQKEVSSPSLTSQTSNLPFSSAASASATTQPSNTSSTAPAQKAVTKRRRSSLSSGLSLGLLPTIARDDQECFSDNGAAARDEAGSSQAAHGSTDVQIDTPRSRFAFLQFAVCSSHFHTLTDI